MIDAAKNDSPREIGLKIFLSAKNVTAAIAILTLVNFFVLGATCLNVYLNRPDVWKAPYLVQVLANLFDMTVESKPGTWYSSMLILLVSIGAALCFLVDRRRFSSGRDRVLSYAWLLIALIFFGLSLDEMGTLHERIGSLNINPWDSWDAGWVSRLAIPIAAVACFFLAFAWMQIRRSGWASLLFAAGTLFYASVPLTEWIGAVRKQAAIAQEIPLVRSIWRIAAEEGGEIFGSLFFLAATLIYLHSAAREGDPKSRAGLSLQFMQKPKYLVLESLACLCLYSLGMAVVWLGTQLVPYSSGILLHWFPSTLAFVAAIVCVQIGADLNGAGKAESYVYWGFAGFFLLFSMYYGGDLAKLPTFPLTQLLVGGSLIAAPILCSRVEDRLSHIGVFAWAALLSFRLIGAEAVAVDFLAFALLLLSLAPHLRRAQCPQEEVGLEHSVQPAEAGALVPPAQNTQSLGKF